MNQDDHSGMFVVHQMVGPIGTSPYSYVGDYGQDQYGGDYYEYDEQDEYQQYESNQQYQQLLSLQMQFPLVLPKQYRNGSRSYNYYNASRRLQAIPEAPSELSDAISLTPVESITSSARNSKILEGNVALANGLRTHEEVLALLHAAEACTAVADNAAVVREQYSKMWSDSITPHKLAIRQLLNTPDLPFIDGPDSAQHTRTTSQNDLNAVVSGNSVNLNVNSGANSTNGNIMVASPSDESVLPTPIRGVEAASKPLRKSPRFVKKLVGFACCGGKL